MTRSHPLLAELLGTVVLELRAGRSRDDALRRMADRAGIDEIRSFATLLIQSGKLGSSIADTLRIYASEMREKRKMRAEESASPSGVDLAAAGRLHASGDDRRADASSGHSCVREHAARDGQLASREWGDWHERDGGSARDRRRADDRAAGRLLDAGFPCARDQRTRVMNGDELLAEGRMQFRNGNFALAVNAFRRATRRAPQSVDAYNGLAASYDRLGRFDLARRYYEEAMAISPADPRVIHNYALSLRLQAGRRGSATAGHRAAAGCGSVRGCPA